MVAPFRTNSDLVSQTIRNKDPDNKTIGPNAPAFSSAAGDPKAFLKNGWVSQLKDSPTAAGLYKDVFSGQAATDAQNKYASFGADPQFKDVNDVAIGKDFLNKYWQTALLNDDEKVHSDSLQFLMAQQPSEGIGGGAVAKMNPPGNSSPSTV